MTAAMGLTKKVAVARKVTKSYPMDAVIGVGCAVASRNVSISPMFVMAKMTAAMGLTKKVAVARKVTKSYPNDAVIGIGCALATGNVLIWPMFVMAKMTAVTTPMSKVVKCQTLIQRPVMS